MKIFRLHREQLVRRPLRDVFDFFARPENLAVITPPWLGFRILTPSPILMKKGTVIDYSIRVMGVRVRWQSLISAYDPFRGFTDEQLKGPYSFWHHTHDFAETDWGTLITDEIQYAMPLGPIGQIGQKLIVQRQLEEIFHHRSRVIERIFGPQNGSRYSFRDFGEVKSETKSGKRARS
jgi:ligand-binding SRPBCC domain-containing protein